MKSKKNIKKLKLSSKAKRIIISTWLATHSLSSIAAKMEFTKEEIDLIQKQLSKELLLSGRGLAKDYLILGKNRAKILSELNSTGIVPDVAPQDIGQNYYEILESLEKVDSSQGLKSTSELMDAVNKLKGSGPKMPLNAAGTWGMYCEGNTSGNDCKIAFEAASPELEVSEMREYIKKLSGVQAPRGGEAAGTWNTYCPDNTTGIDCKIAPESEIAPELEVSEMREYIKKLSGVQAPRGGEAAGTWNTYCPDNTTGIDCKEFQNLKDSDLFKGINMNRYKNF